jgi:hypothetical protein
MSVNNQQFDRDLEPIRLRGVRFPLHFNVIVPFSVVADDLGAPITRRMWLEEPEADVYLGVPYTLSFPKGSRCLWVPRRNGLIEFISPSGSTTLVDRIPEVPIAVDVE